MLYTKLQQQRPIGSVAEVFLWFLPYMGMVAILVMWPESFEQTFQSHRPFGSREEECFMFLPYMGMAAILVMWPGPFWTNFWLPIWNSQNCSMFPLAFVAGWLQGHWWGFISRNYVVWHTFLLMNVFIALKESHFWFLFRSSIPLKRHMELGFNRPSAFSGKEVWKYCIWVTLDQGHWMTLTFDIDIVHVLI